VVLAALKDVALVDPQGDRLQVLPGTEASITQAGGRRRMLLLLFSAGLGLMAHRCKQAQAKTWQEFVARSNL
jgi:hypothetical protein